MTLETTPGKTTPGKTTPGRGVSRCATLQAGIGGLAASALTAPAVHGQPRVTLRCAFSDHWVPAGNGAQRDLCAEFSQRERVDGQVDVITSVGPQNELTIAAQAQGRSGPRHPLPPDLAARCLCRPARCRR